MWGLWVERPTTTRRKNEGCEWGYYIDGQIFFFFVQLNCVIFVIRLRNMGLNRIQLYINIYSILRTAEKVIKNIIVNYLVTCVLLHIENKIVINGYINVIVMFGFFFFFRYYIFKRIAYCHMIIKHKSRYTYYLHSYIPK